MRSIILTLTLLLVLLPLAIGAQCANCPTSQVAGNQQASSTQSSAKKYIFTSPKKLYSISDSHNISYKWQSKPKIGENILLLTVYTKAKKLSNDLTITANSYMPSMRGSHDTGPIKMKINKKQVYAIPVNLVMLGDWEVELQFAKGGKNIYTGYIRLDI